MEDFLKQYKMRKMECVNFFGLMLFFYLFGFCCTIILKHLQKDNVVVMAGTMFAVVPVLFIYLIWIINSFLQQFNIAISMGVTRKSFVKNYVLFSMAEFFGMELLLLVLANLEKRLLQSMFPNAVLQLELLPYLKWESFGMALIAVTATIFFVAALILRYGMKVLWAIWVVWMVGVFVMQKIEKICVVEILKEAQPAMFVLLLLLFFFLGKIAWELLKKQRVI